MDTREEKQAPAQPAKKARGLSGGQKVIIGLVGIVFSITVVPILFFRSDRITVAEIRYYVVIYLLLNMAGLFALLRLYNAVVVNSGMMARLTRMLQLANAGFERLVRNLEKTRTAISSNTGDIQKLQATVQRLADVIKDAFRRGK